MVTAVDMALSFEPQNALGVLSAVHDYLSSAGGPGHGVALAQCVAANAARLRSPSAPWPHGGRAEARAAVRAAAPDHAEAVAALADELRVDDRVALALLARAYAADAGCEYAGALPGAAAAILGMPRAGPPDVHARARALAYAERCALAIALQVCV